MGNGIGTKFEKVGMNFIDVNDFKFHGTFEIENSNGLYLNDCYIPEEIICNILSYVPPQNLLSLTLVCKRWCSIIKSEHFWMLLYQKLYSYKAKQLPWYVYYSYFTTKNYKNLLRNTTGGEGFKHWDIIRNFGDEFQIQNPPAGSDPLPLKEKDFNGETGCFATSFYECNKIQEISLKNKRLLRYIIKHHKPHIYASEWMAGRFDCGCVYMLKISGYGEKYLERKETKRGHRFFEHEPLFCKSAQERVEQWQGGAWKKVEIVVDQYPADVSVLVFEHEGQDTQFWKGHYGSKMAGGVLRFDFDSIQPIKEESDNQENNAFS